VDPSSISPGRFLFFPEIKVICAWRIARQPPGGTQPETPSAGARPVKKNWFNKDKERSLQLAGKHYSGMHGAPGL